MKTYGFAAAQRSSILAASLLRPHRQTVKNLFTPICLKISSSQFGAELSRSLIAGRIYTIRVTTLRLAAQIRFRAKPRAWFRAVIATIASLSPERSGALGQERKRLQTRRIAR